MTDYAWIVERFKAVHDGFASEAATKESKEYLARLKEAYATGESVIDAVDDARRDFGHILQKLGERPLGDEKPLPRDAYERPLLDVLLAMDGSGQARDVLDRLGELMARRLPVADLKPVPSSGEPRWRKIAQWARYEMVLKGLLRSDAPRGTWALTDEGWQLAEKRAQ